MTSWRDSDDPRCPACGEKITATASYCMHCEADFAEDGSIVSGPNEGTADDVSAGGTQSDGNVGTDWSTADDSVDATDSDDVGYDASDSPAVGQDTTDSPAVGQYQDDPPGVPVEEGASPGAGGSVDAGDVEKTTLLLRGPVCVIMGLPAGVLTLIAVGFALADLSGGVAAGTFLLGWIGTTAYLLRKPLASDAIGDGFYVYAALLLALPILISLGMLARALLGLSQDSVGSALAIGITMELFFAVPAAFFVVIGYIANYYAKQKMEAALDRRGGAA